ncbi:helix-turn-helix transcriptional regulator [Hymenobacter arizonensis]|uniref:DNA-binding transcriptional regulator, XRE-family HTH domain n=1 Tax=Hymenobacter arizonensis TaxID=1227077 RepID=A0A1I5YY22_HYMAR|nr:helix-turn-helix transcriptional regulator [Hymenobacter arizonensis]SFQ49138.1 DNA-binding transcriptional regulator, XRE-family HTH domain [Hymenobacter arizonensis]
MAKKPVQGRPLDGEPELADLGSTLQDTTDSLIGAPGTPQRNEYEDLLQRKIVSAKLREYRKLHDLTQEELGERLGVLKNQIAKLERDSSNIRLGTLFKVFRALGVGVKLQFEAPPIPPSKLAKLAVFALLFFSTYSNPSPAAAAGLVCFLV